MRKGRILPTKEQDADVRKKNKAEETQHCFVTPLVYNGMTARVLQTTPFNISYNLILKW